ncbi:MAG: hypothetical protein JJU45_10475 [Acidimicrobiia bacterium]|nr:hypothetical protein [Acidimicrobiia bacterium]
MSSRRRTGEGADGRQLRATLRVLNEHPAALHERPFPSTVPSRVPSPIEVEVDEAQVWWCRPTVDAVVLGSTQRSHAHHVTPPPLAATVVRRSGGGAVWVRSQAQVWIDVLIPRRWPGWSDDVHHASVWLGERWAATLGRLGLAAEVHRSGVHSDEAGRLVCFAGLGPGEVLVEGRKVVGVSQRRARDGARLQSMAYVGEFPSVTTAAALGPLAEPLGGTAALAGLLDRRAAALPLAEDVLCSTLTEEVLDGLLDGLVDGLSIGQSDNRSDNRSGNRSGNRSDGLGGGAIPGDGVHRYSGAPHGHFRQDPAHR